MKTKIHGLTSLGLILLAVLIAAVAMFKLSWAWGAAYLVIGLAASLIILYAFCAKCLSRTHCGHVLPGKAAQAFKNRIPGPYTPADLMVTVLAFLLLLGLPHVALWRKLSFLIAFWVLLGTALVQIRVFVCRACRNVNCPAGCGQAC